MTDAASKAALERAVSDLWEHHIQDKSPFEGHAAIVRAISAAVAEEHALREAETDEYDALLKQINKNLEPMKKAWQEATGQPEVSPGTPTLVKWWQAERERAGKLVELLVKETKYWHEHCDGCSLDTRVAFCPDDHCAEACQVISAYEMQP